MKRLLIKTSLLIFLAVTIANVYMLYGKDEYSLHSHERNVYLAYQRLDSLKDSTKIVIIAGSNGQFSMNSRILKDSLHLPVVNTCTHAGIGVRMQFEMYKEFLKKGDVLLFIPEYYDESRLYGSTTLIRVLRSQLPNNYKKLSLAQILHLYKYIGVSYLETRKHKGTEGFSGPYSVSSVNEFGDIECKREHKEIKEKYTFKGEMDAETLEYYKYIHSYCDERGTRIVYLPPVLIKSNYDEQKHQIDSLAQFMRKNGIPYMAEPRRYAFPDSLFFDTPYHMTDVGADVRTQAVVEDVRKNIKTQ